MGSPSLGQWPQSSQQSEESSTFPPIGSYGVIGNCHTAALVGKAGSIDWLCLPRFDSPSLFARILDLQKGGFWSLQPTSGFESSRQYLDDTNILKTTFTSESGTVVLLDFMEITDSEETAYPKAPGRLIRIVEGVKGAVEIACNCSPRPNYGRRLPQFSLQETTARFEDFEAISPVAWQVDPQAQALTCQVTVQAGERVAFALAMQDSPVPHATPEDALASAIAFWRNWVSQCTYQGPYRDAVIRSSLALKLMSYAPTGAIVAAPTASLPEKLGGERNWDYRFTWVRDASFTLYALLMAGYFDNRHPFFDWLAQTAQLEGTGIHILYPITNEGQAVEQILEHFQGYANSRPVRIGNAAVGQVQLDVYGEVLSALHFAWKAGKYDPSEIWQHIQPMLDWVVDHWQEPDSGIWEVRGGLRHFVYGKVMLWVALDCGVDMAESLGLSGNTQRWRQERDRIRAEVFEKGWSDKLGAFKQSYEDETLDASNLLMPVVGFIDGTDPRMIATVDATLKNLVSNGLCYRYRNAPEGVQGPEASFVLCTFWLINSLILAGRVEEAAAWFEQMLAKSTPLGLFAEEIDPTNGTHLGNFPQAFSHIGVINVAVSLAHVGYAGTVEPHHQAAADAAKRGGGAAATH